jgi:lipoate-protein ligase A
VIKLRNIPYLSLDAAGNMACDALMLDRSAGTGTVIWRFYGWTEPAMTFGYSQRWEWIRSQLPGGIDACIRRLTGGGIVDHRRDLTYALAIPATHPAHRWKAQNLYRELHGGIASLLESAGVGAVLAPCPDTCPGNDRVAASGICFAAPAPSDVIDPVSGRKFAGAAMKRSRSGILIQGSVDRHSLPSAAVEHLQGAFGGFLRDWLALPEPEPAEAPDAGTLRERSARFADPSWNRQR